MQMVLEFDLDVSVVFVNCWWCETSQPTIWLLWLNKVRDYMQQTVCCSLEHISSHVHM